MLKYRWANDEKTGLCHEENDTTVFTDDPDFLALAVSGGLGDIGNPVVISYYEDMTLQSDEVRSKRNALLVASDWTQLPDAPVDQTVWAAYRQALRDVTDQEGFPVNVEWPVAP